MTHRYALNIKGLPHTTKWVEYPDIENVCKEISAAPTSKMPDNPSQDYYTLPVIQDPNTGRVVSDSWNIAKYLDEQYPETHRLFPKHTLAFQALFNDFVWGGQGLFIDVFMNCVVETVASLNPPTAEHMRASRERWFGRKIETFASEEHWKNIEQGFAKLATILEENGHGKNTFFGGDTITYSDLQVAAGLYWARVVWGKDSEKWKRLVGSQDGKWVQFLAKFEKYAAIH